MSLHIMYMHKMFLLWRYNGLPFISQTLRAVEPIYENPCLRSRTQKLVGPMYECTFLVAFSSQTQASVLKAGADPNSKNRVAGRVGPTENVK